MQIELIPAPITTKSKIAEFLQPYLRELAPFFGGNDDPNAIFDYPYLDAYWQEPDERYPFLILADGVTAGFAFADRYSRLGLPNTLSVSEFYVAPEFRRLGVGEFAARALFQQLSSRWEVAVLSGNDVAERFWNRAMAAVADSAIQRHQTDSWNGTIFTFTVADDTDTI